MNSQKHPRLLNEAVLNSECPKMSREGKGQFLYVSQAALWLQWHLVQGVSNKGTITFCGTDEPGWWWEQDWAGELGYGISTWVRVIGWSWYKSEGWKSQKKARKAADFRMQRKSSTEFQKRLAAGWEIGGSQVTLNWKEAPGKVNQIVSYGEEFNGWTWLGIEPSSALFLCHLCDSWSLRVQ